MEESLFGYALLTCNDDSLAETLLNIEEIKLKQMATSSTELKPVSLYNELVLDPMYCSIDHYYPRTAIGFDNSEETLMEETAFSFDTKAISNDFLINLTQRFARISSSVAICMSLILPDNSDWTYNK